MRRNCGHYFTSSSYGGFFHCDFTVFSDSVHLDVGSWLSADSLGALVGQQLLVVEGSTWHG